MITEISARLDCCDILRACGIEAHGRERIPCPIHRGDGRNFAILEGGTSWRCFSHNCGGGYRRDAINLFCWLPGRAKRC